MTKTRNDIIICVVVAVALTPQLFKQVGFFQVRATQATERMMGILDRTLKGEILTENFLWRLLHSVLKRLVFTKLIEVLKKDKIFLYF